MTVLNMRRHKTHSSTDEESQSTTDETVKNDGDEGVIVENGDNAEINESIEPVSIEPTENGVTEEVSEDKDQVPVLGPSAEDNQAIEEDENDDDDEFDDFGDFGDNDGESCPLLLSSSSQIEHTI